MINMEAQGSPTLLYTLQHTCLNDFMITLRFERAAGDADGLISSHTLRLTPHASRVPTSMTPPVSSC